MNSFRFNSLKYSVAAPKTDGLQPIACSILVADLTETQIGSKQITLASPRLEVIGLGWNTKVELPQWPLAIATSRVRIGVNFLGSNQKTNPVLDDSLIKATTHVTHSSTDL